MVSDDGQCPRKPGEYFDAAYMDYWKERVDVASDGTRVPGIEIARTYCERLLIEPGHTVLDVGCGFGRLCGVLLGFTPHVIGMDLSPEVLETASDAGYSRLVAGSAEASGLPANSIDRAVVWSVFDVVNQEQALEEMYRVLKPGGQLLLTGKNSEYRADDEIAFIAERNARLKGFPNHFTHTLRMRDSASDYGFSVRLLHGFERRGDFGLNRPINLLDSPLATFYEFLVILEKNSNVSVLLHGASICNESSVTAQRLAKTSGFGCDVDAYFRFHTDRELAKVDLQHNSKGNGGL